MVDEATKKTLASIPLLRTNAGPRDGDVWATRLKEEYLSLIKVHSFSLSLSLPLSLSLSLSHVRECMTVLHGRFSVNTQCCPLHHCEGRVRNYYYAVARVPVMADHRTGEC